MNTILSKPVFSLGERTYTWLDVVLAAIVRGDWAALETQVSLGLALVERAGEADELPEEAEIDAAAEEFRYDRDLVTAEEMEGWLGRCGLTLEEWMEYIERLVVRQAETDPDDDSLLESFDAEAVGANVIIEAICSGELYRFAQTLAGRAAIASRAADAEALSMATRSTAPSNGRRGWSSGRDWDSTPAPAWTRFGRSPDWSSSSSAPRAAS